MHLTNDSVSLVVAGAWNAALLNPSWMLAYGLRQEAEQVQITILSPLSAGPASYGLPSLRYTVNPKALVLQPQVADAAGMATVQGTAIAILEQLPHTPVAAVGFNFRFESDDSDQLLDVFRQSQLGVVDSAPDGWAVTGNKIRTTLSNDGQLWNVTNGYQDDVVFVEFNLHIPAASVASALEVLREQSLQSAFDTASSWAKALFNEELQDNA